MPAHQFDLGRLLRVRAMVTAAQVEATDKAGLALVRAYTGLVAEMNLVLSEGTEELREEFARIFTPIQEPAPLNARMMAVQATEAFVKLRQIGGWIQGLIDELTLDERLRLEAEAKVKAENQPPTGFSTG